MTMDRTSALRIPLGALGWLVITTRDAWAGMTSYTLNEVVRLRLEDVSFFALLLGICALGIRFLWNHFVKGLPNLPRLSFFRALCLTGLLSLMMLLVLSMISGARELLTPGVWRRQGTEYRLHDTASELHRRQCMDFLRASLTTYAAQHGGKYPPHEFVPDIPERVWQAPDSVGTRYIYVAGLGTDCGTNIVACEPVNFGEERLVLLANGTMQKMNTSAIRAVLGIKELSR